MFEEGCQISLPTDYDCIFYESKEERFWKHLGIRKKNIGYRHFQIHFFHDIFKKNFLKGLLKLRII